MSLKSSSASSPNPPESARRSGRRLALRIYSEVIQRRQQLQIVPVPDQVVGREQAFIVGLYRSGTTPLRLTLDSHSKIASPPETQFMRPLLELPEDPETIKGLSGLGYKPDAYRAELAALAAKLMDRHVEAVKPVATHWIDKTPHYTLMAESFVEAFPRARFIFLFRNPVHQIDSLTEGGNTKSFLLDGYAGSAVQAAASYWCDGVRSMARAISLAADRSHVVGYEELCDDPGRVVSGITSFLGLDFEAAMLSYGQKSHTPGLEGAKAFEFSRFETIERTRPGWLVSDPAAKAIFEQTAADLGYADSSWPNASRLRGGAAALSGQSQPES